MFAWSYWDEGNLDAKADSDGMKTKLMVGTQHAGNQVAVAEPILASGKHSWVVRVLESHNGWGDGMVMGVVDATVELNDPKGAKAWGFLPLSGCVQCTPSPQHPGVKGKQVSEPLSGFVTGAHVRVQVDMERRTLAFAVNGGEFVDAGVTLTPQVRPWALMCYPGDALQLEVAP